jgi:hypothetical protein
MQIAVCIRRGVVIDDNVHSLNIDPTAKYISGYENTLLKVFELLVSGNPVQSQGTSMWI